MERGVLTPGPPCGPADLPLRVAALLLSAGYTARALGTDPRRGPGGGAEEEAALAERLAGSTATGGRRSCWSWYALTPPPCSGWTLPARSARTIPFPTSGSTR
ncbi:hypothetical protein GCM10018952_18720 [Streptosporangium vulgare]